MSLSLPELAGPAQRPEPVERRGSGLLPDSAGRRRVDARPRADAPRLSGSAIVFNDVERLAADILSRRLAHPEHSRLFDPSMAAPISEKCLEVAEAFATAALHRRNRRC